MEIKAVIFDLDGTLINSIEDIADANNSMLESYGLPIHELKEYVKWIGNGARRLVEFSLPPEKRGVDNMDFLIKYQACYQKNICNKSKLYEGIGEVLDFLTKKNIPFAINTNKPQNLTDLVVESYLKNWPFSNVIGHSNHFPHKPDPKGALHFAKQINCDPKKVLFIGDSCVDVQTAIAAGMVPMGVSWGYGNPSLGGDDVNTIDESQEIIDYIIKNNKYEN